MCGRFAQDADAEELQRRFEIDRLARLPPERRRYNVAPTDAAAAVRLDAEGRRELVMLRWGLLPAWKRDTERLPINARAEGIDQNRFFAPAIRKRRCLIPARVFYEWARADKQPWRIGRRDGELIALAGLWERNDRLQDEAIESFAVVTTAPNALLATIHDRMPVILPPEAWAAWLDPHTDAAAVLPLLAPAPPADLQAVPISRAVNDARRDGPELLEAVGEPRIIPA